MGAALDGGTWHCKVMCEWNRSSGGSAHCIDVHLVADWALKALAKHMERRCPVLCGTKTGTLHWRANYLLKTELFPGLTILERRLMEYFSRIAQS